MPLSPFVHDFKSSTGSTGNLFQKALQTWMSESLPYFKQSTGCIGDFKTLFLHMSLEPREKWSNGIFHNSHYLIVRISQVGNDLVLEHVNTTFHRNADGSTVNLPKVRKQRKANLDSIIAALEKWKTEAEAIVSHG